MEKPVEPDGYVKKLTPKHTPSDPDLVKRLEESMRQYGWIGRPLMVAKIKNGGGRYKYGGITGSHRATAAMNVGIPIPAVFVTTADVTRKQWKFIMKHSEGLDTLFDEAKMPRAAGLMRQEPELGGTAAKVEPPKREKTEGRRFRPKRVEPC
jgi:ParB-like nuclease domain